MHFNRRTALRTAACGLAVATHPLFLRAASTVSVGELQVIAAVLRAQAERRGKHPVLVAGKRFSTGRMTVQSAQPTAMQKASHQVELPYLVPAVGRTADADQLAAAYNDSLGGPALQLGDDPIFTFPHHVLNDTEVTQFQALNPGGGVYSEDIERQRRAVPAYYRRLFDGATTLYEVSRAAFHAGDTMAVICLRSSGGGCSTEAWYVLEVIGGMWHDLRWGAGSTTCA